MADEVTEQPVVGETNAAAQPAAAASSNAPEHEELESLLRQFEESATPAAPARAAAQPSSEQTPTEDLNARIARLAEYQEAEIKKRQKDETDKAVAEATRSVRGQLPDTPEVNEMAEAWLNRAAGKDPRIQTAFANRDKDPQTWAKVLNVLSKDFGKRFASLTRQPDANLTEDREAVSAAVRNASATAPAAKEPDIKRMTDAELRKHNQEKYGYTPHF